MLLCMQVAAPDGTMEKIYVQENVTMMEKPNSNETILLAEDKMQMRNETTNEIIYEASNENEFMLDEKFDVSTVSARFLLELILDLDAMVMSSTLKLLSLVIFPYKNRLIIVYHYIRRRWSHADHSMIIELSDTMLIMYVVVIHLYDSRVVI